LRLKALPRDLGVRSAKELVLKLLNEKGCAELSEIKELLVRNGMDEKKAEQYIKSTLYSYADVLGNVACLPTAYEVGGEERLEVKEETSTEGVKGGSADLVVKAVEYARSKVKQVADELVKLGKKNFALVPVIELKDGSAVVEIWYLKKVGQRRYVPHPSPVVTAVIKRGKVEEVKEGSVEETEEVAKSVNKEGRPKARDQNA